MTTVDRDKVSETLQTERARLLHQLEELGADETGELTGDIDFGGAFADAGAATAERTETMGIVENLRHQLRRVDRALERVADGTYGTCGGCGRQIGKDRLEFRPMSVLCIDCKSKR